MFIVDKVTPTMSTAMSTVRVKTEYNEFISFDFNHRDVTPDDIAITLHLHYPERFPYSTSKSKKGKDYTDVLLIDSMCNPPLYSAVTVYGSLLPMKIIHTAYNQRVYQFELDTSPPIKKISYNPQTLDPIQLDTNLFIAFLD